MQYDQLILKNSGILLATEYIRVVHGGRGDYIELKYDQIIPKLYYK